MRIGPSFVVMAVLALVSCSPGEDSGAGAASTLPGTSLTTTSAPPSSSDTSSTSTSSTTTSVATTITTTTTSATTTEAPDTTPPELAVTDPRAGGVVTTSAYRFVGVTEPGASVVAAGRYEADVAADGTWSIVLMLNLGGNVATFVAEDAAGNTTELRVPVYLHACIGTPEVVMAGGGSEAMTLTGDLDGDGQPDVITTYLADGRWRLHVELAYGWETETDITPYVTNVPPPSPARIVDLGRPAVVVDLGGNLVGSSYGFVAFAGCMLRPILDEAGLLPDVWVGIGISHSEFFTCGRGAVTQVQMGRGETSINVVETRYPFSTGSGSFGAATVTDEEIPAPPIPSDGSADTAWEDEVVRRRAAACVP